MGDKSKDGGPVFPHGMDQYPSAMTLRDWFAGQALVGILPLVIERAMAGPDASLATQAARNAYAAADAMLAERAKP